MGKAAGGVDVFVSLWHKHAEVLRDIAYTIDWSMIG